MSGWKMDVTQRTPVSAGPTRWIRTVAATAVVVATLGMTAQPAGAARKTHDRAAADAAGHIPVWAADFMAGAVQVSPERAVRQARDFDMIVALKGTYQPYVAQMKAANPDLQILVYLNGVMAQSNEGSAYPDSWYATDAQGQRVRSLGFGNYLMRPDGKGWVTDVADRCRSFLHESGYDGCFLDVLGVAPLSPSYVTGVPVDPRTLTPWNETQWLAATRRISAATRAAVAPAPVYGNGLAYGERYFASVPSSSILPPLDGAMAESFVRDPTAPAEEFRPRGEWRADVRMLADVASRGANALSMTKVWTTATARQRTALQRYALGTFLLGYEPGNGYFSFRDDHGLTRYRPMWSVDLGVPLEAAHQVGQAWIRTFENGVVVVNPTAARVRVGLDATSVRAATGRHARARRSANVVVGAHSASILTD
jgi:hypothetical protein